MKRARLPLTALRSFEAAGRLASFTRAAEELHVSQAAISRQVRELEALIGRPLFERRHRSVVLTDEAAQLLATLTGAFDEVSAGLDALVAARARPSLTVSAEPNFAGCWLVPNLPDFQAAHPEVDVSIEADPRLVDFRAHPAEVGIRFTEGPGDWPRTAARLLCRIDLVAVMAPALAAAAPAAKPGDLADRGLLHEVSRDLWQRWFEAAGAGEVAIERGPILSDVSMVLQGVQRGHGVGLVDRIFVADDIAAGRLVQPFPTTIRYGAFWLVARDLDRLSPAAAAFAAWLTNRIAVAPLTPVSEV